MNEKTFRIAVMGNIDYIDIELFLEGVDMVLQEMNCKEKTIK
jgi:aspartate aminotransferase-like enzyme